VYFLPWPGNKQAGHKRAEETQDEGEQDEARNAKAERQAENNEREQREDSEKPHHTIIFAQAVPRVWRSTGWRSHASLGLISIPKPGCGGVVDARSGCPVGHGSLEAPNRLPEALPQLRQLLRSKHEQRNPRNHQQMQRLK
jgi:hypothetical protein